MTTHVNLNAPELYEHALSRGEGILGTTGALVVNTGKYTGRSPNDKFTVNEESSAHSVNWGKTNRPFEKDAFYDLEKRVLDYLDSKEDTYEQNVTAGSDIAVRVVTERAWHSLFAQNMFKPLQTTEDEEEEFSPDLTILHAPGFKAIPDRDGTNSEAFVIVNFYRKLVIIGGTEYAGEIKKAAFYFMNYVYPLQGTMTLHASANVDVDGNGAVFFGLSGTGKTTLSADTARDLVGDDEHGWDDNGIFNLEGGCYAKVIDLDPTKEPLIHTAINTFGAIQENVWVDSITRSSDLSCATITENTRSSYPLGHIPNAVPSGTMGHPKDIIMLTCDSFGVLPPISRLTPRQAMYHFLSGYTSKIAGTEAGVTEPEAVFSACFGEPFMALDARVYGELLRKKIEEHDIRCWLLNTGWSGGGYGIGARMDIDHTRTLLNAALSGALDDVPMVEHPVFKVMIPTMCREVPNMMLDPVKTWESESDYNKVAYALVEAFETNYKRFDVEV
jgi:phosphoenolpyruvate carboxykinase (ATP)